VKQFQYKQPADGCGWTFLDRKALLICVKNLWGACFLDFLPLLDEAGIVEGGNLGVLCMAPHAQSVISIYLVERKRCCHTPLDKETQPKYKTQPPSPQSCGDLRTPHPNKDKNSSAVCVLPFMWGKRFFGCGCSCLHNQNTAAHSKTP